MNTKPSPGNLSSADVENASAWISVVAEKVNTMRFGVVQIVVHDSKVVQIERTERTRFEVPRNGTND